MSPGVAARPGPDGSQPVNAGCAFCAVAGLAFFSVVLAPRTPLPELFGAAPAFEPVVPAL